MDQRDHSEPPPEPQVPQGYLPPPSAFQAAIEPFALDNDPLVNDPANGVGG